MRFRLPTIASVFIIATVGYAGTGRPESTSRIPVSPDSAAVDSGQITAARPPVSAGGSNVVRTIDQDFFTNLPVRGIDPAILLQPGVMAEATNVFGEPLVSVRGGREGEIEYRLEGVPLNDLVWGGRGIAVTAEAVEQLRVQAGGPAAGFGGGGSGLVGIRLRTGREDRWGGSILAETDRYTGMNSKSLGGYSYGYSDWTGTAGGPVPGLGNLLRLFGSVQNTFYRDPAVSVRSGYNFSGANAVVTDPVITPQHAAARPDTLNIVSPDGNAPGGSDNRWVMTGTALVDLSPFRLRLAGSYAYERSQTPAGLATLLDQSRLPLAVTKDGFVSAKFSHQVSPSFGYEAGFSYAANSSVTEDPRLLDDLFAYGDPSANAALGYTLRSVGGQSLNWPAYLLWNDSFSIVQPGTEIAGYEKTSQESFGGRGALTFSTGSHEFTLGGEFTSYTTRDFAPYNVMQFWNTRNAYPAPDSLARALAQILTGSGWGYDVYGREINSDDVRGGALYSLGPKRPSAWDGFVQDRIELPGIAIALGVRYDHIDPGSKTVADPAHLQFSQDNLLLASQLRSAETYSQISPRIGVSLPLSGDLNLHAQFGRFMQPLSATGGDLKPPRTTQVEVGLSGQLCDVLGFDVTGFYRNVTNQLSMIAIPEDATGSTGVISRGGGSGNAYVVFQNGDDVTPKGVEIALSLRRTHRFAAQVNYTLQDVNTTWLGSLNGASPLSSYIVARYLVGVDYNSVHRGSVRLDYRYGRDEGSGLLDGLGVSLLLRFNSGHNITTLLQSVGDPRFRIPTGPGVVSTTPWFSQVDGRLDKAISLGPVGLDIYLYVINLLGTDNAVNIFPGSGDPSNDGLFTSGGGGLLASQYGPQFVAFWNAAVEGKNSGNWGPPRQIRFGLRLDY